MMSASLRSGAGAAAACLGWMLKVIVLLGAALVPQATAAFVEPYALNSFVLFNSGEFDNGTAEIHDGDLVLTGSNSGSGAPGYTVLTTFSASSGVFHFAYLYTSIDIPGADFASYLLGGSVYPLADTSGQSGTVTVPVQTGELIGFRIDTLDNIGEAGVLTVSEFSAPTPEPSAFWLTATAAGLLCFLRKALRAQRAGLSKPCVWILGAALMTGTVPVRAQVQNDFSGTNVTGEIRFLRAVNLSQQAQGLRLLGASRAGVEKRPKVPPKRLRPPLSANFSAQAFTAVPAKSLTIMFNANATGFNALSHRDQRLAYGENQFSIEPPSQSIAVGNGYLLEGVNDAVQVYTLAGLPALPSAVASNQLFGLAPAIDWNTGVNGVYLTDMRVYFDQGINRWFVLQRSQDNDSQGNLLNQSHLYVAVSKTGDPTGDYNIYLMDTTNASNPGCPCLADYPQVGADQFGIHISWNEFSTSTLVFVDAVILSLSKASLASDAAAPSAYKFTLTFTTGYEFAIAPATTPPGASNFIASGGVEYLVSSLARSAASSSLALWALRNTSSLATPNPTLVLSRTVLQALPYAFPDVATQRPGPLPYGSSLNPRGTLAFLDGGDSRVLSLSYAGGRLYLTLQTGVTDENNRWVVGAAYVVLSPTLRSNVLAGSVINQGYLVVNNNHILRPAIAVNAQGRGAIAVTLTGADWFPTAALIPFQALATPATVEIVGLGALPEDGFSGYPDFGGVGVARWGDYNSAAAYSDGTIWMAAQYVGDLPRTTYANWNTFVMHKLP